MVDEYKVINVHRKILFWLGLKLEQKFSPIYKHHQMK